jgi:hypothetical protein
MHLFAGTAQAILSAAHIVYSWIQSFGKFNDPATWSIRFNKLYSVPGQI